MKATKKLDSLQIQEIAKRKGEFAVHRWKYSTINLKNKCQKMAKKGKLKFKKATQAHLIFLPVLSKGCSDSNE